MAELATYELDGRIATITMDDGKANALSIAMLKALMAALDRAEEDGAVVVLTGRERFFSAGFDLEVFSERPHEIVEMLTLGARLSERLLSFPTPCWSPAAATRSPPAPSRRSPRTSGSASRAPTSSASTRSGSASRCPSTWSSSPASGSPRAITTARW